VDSTVQIITKSQSLSFNFEGDVESVHCYDDTADALQIAEDYQPGVILLDYKLEKLNTGLYIKSLLSESPSSKVILLGEYLAEEIILDCIIFGATGYLEYRDMDKLLSKAVQSVMHGQAWITRRLVGVLIERIRD